ncbi:STAS domain-containing protein [Amycolatopsis sp. FDAARGOS 1241]|nr:STAS domain-containing protein [Amycolatopsis sp. FDAARGOS 1241]
MVIAVRGEFDALTTPVLQEAIHDALAEGPRVLVMDLSETAFFSSTAIGALVDAELTAGESTPVRLAASPRTLQVSGSRPALRLLRHHPRRPPAALNRAARGPQPTAGILARHADMPWHAPPLISGDQGAATGCVRPATRTVSLRRRCTCDTRPASRMRPSSGKPLSAGPAPATCPTP